MKKTERINTMMRFINNRAHFTISEIMEEFNISRSTAFRDIAEIEAIGLPLVAEVGRGGGYSVLKNAMLPAVHFTDNEVKALFIALLATKNQQLPFLESRITLSEKLIGLLTELQQDDLVLLSDLLRFPGTNPGNPDLLDMSDLAHPVLDQLIHLLLEDRYLKIKTKEKSYSIYLLHMYHTYGQWFVEAIELEHLSIISLAVSTLEEIDIVETAPLLSKVTIKKILKQQTASYNLTLRLGPNAIKQYKKYHPINVILEYTHPFQLTANCKIAVDITNTEELELMTNWLYFLGKDVKIEKCPPELTEVINKHTIL